eukprot:gene1162-4056_t
MASLYSMTGSTALLSASSHPRSLLDTGVDAFPYRQCDSTDITDSPFRIGLRTIASSPGGMRTCFAFVATGCDDSSGCNESVKEVTLDGVTHPFTLNTSFASPKLQITNLGLNRSSAARSNMCITLALGPCYTMDALCGRGDGLEDGDFPYCECTRSMMLSNYMLSTPQPSVTSTGLQQYCFQIRHNTTKCTAKTRECCNFDVHKVEFSVNPSCTHSLVYTTVDGEGKAPFMALNPGPTIRVTNFFRASNNANATEVCLVLRPPCGTLNELCPQGNCKYAIFNSRSEERKCCPVGLAGIQLLFRVFLFAVSCSFLAASCSASLLLVHRLPLQQLPVQLPCSSCTACPSSSFLFSFLAPLAPVETTSSNVLSAYVQHSICLHSSPALPLQQVAWRQLPVSASCTVHRLAPPAASWQLPVQIPCSLAPLAPPAASWQLPIQLPCSSCTACPAFSMGLPKKSFGAYLFSFARPAAPWFWQRKLAPAMASFLFSLPCLLHGGHNPAASWQLPIQLALPAPWWPQSSSFLAASYSACPACSMVTTIRGGSFWVELPIQLPPAPASWWPQSSSFLLSLPCLLLLHRLTFQQLPGSFLFSLLALRDPLDHCPRSMLSLAA